MDPDRHRAHQQLPAVLGAGGPDQPRSQQRRAAAVLRPADPIGPATPEPRPYINVVTNADDSVVVNYQWQQGHDSPKSPTGIATVRFRIGDDGKLVAVDPIPKP